MRVARGRRQQRQRPHVRLGERAAAVLLRPAHGLGRPGPQPAAAAVPPPGLELRGRPHVAVARVALRVPGLRPRLPGDLPRLRAGAPLRGRAVQRGQPALWLRGHGGQVHVLHGGRGGEALDLRRGQLPARQRGRLDVRSPHRRRGARAAAQPSGGQHHLPAHSECLRDARWTADLFRGVFLGQRSTRRRPGQRHPQLRALGATLARRLPRALRVGGQRDRWHDRRGAARALPQRSAGLGAGREAVGGPALHAGARSRGWHRRCLRKRRQLRSAGHLPHLPSVRCPGGLRGQRRRQSRASAAGSLSSGCAIAGLRGLCSPPAGAPLRRWRHGILALFAGGRRLPLS
mmetsp:Transcript_34538/g.99100  ORF Transcript_34538/g.99100 Transcript_34538/m.99100 type:complete len:346 (-) Transcript_34538:630-1667(-)